jgi:cell division septation protein DedD
MKSSEFIQKHKTSIAIITIFLALIITLAPGIITYINEYNLMAQELNKLGVQLESIDNKSNNITLVSNKHNTQDITIQKAEKEVIPNISPYNNEPNKANSVDTASAASKDVRVKTQVAAVAEPPTKVDYAPLQEAMDSAIGLEDEDPKSSPFDEPKVTIVKKQSPQTKHIHTVKKPLKLQHKATSKSLTYVVQLAIFKNKNSAHSLQTKLKKAGFDAVISSHNKVYRVLIISTQNSKSGAIKLHNKILLKLKINGYIKQIKI